MNANELQELTLTILDMLEELPQRHKMDTVGWNILHHGMDAVEALAHEAVGVHASEGRRREDGGWRTLGGVFFQLAREHGWEVSARICRRGLRNWATYGEQTTELLEPDLIKRRNRQRKRERQRERKRQREAGLTP